MRNVLFATSALISIAGTAMAEVTLIGSAEMGVTHIDNGDGNGTDVDGVLPGEDNTEFHNDIDVTFTLSGATDNGLTFGASIDLDEADGTAVIESSNSVFISGAFGTLSMGDVDGAYDQALDGIPAGGLNDEADQASGTSGLDGGISNIGFAGGEFGSFDFSGDGEILRYDYAVSGLTVSASVELEEDDVTDNIYGIGVAYSGEAGNITYDVGVGYQTGEIIGFDVDAYGASAVVGFGAFALTAVFERLDLSGEDLDTWGLGAEYGFDGFTVAGGYQRKEFTNDGFPIDEDLYQVYATYDLTGGAEVVAAVSYVENGLLLGKGLTRAGLGLGFSF